MRTGLWSPAGLAEKGQRVQERLEDYRYSGRSP